MKGVFYGPISKTNYVIEDAFIKKVFNLKKQQQYVFWSFFFLIKNYWSICWLWDKTTALRDISTKSDGSLALVFADIFYQLNVFFRTIFINVPKYFIAITDTSLIFNINLTPLSRKRREIKKKSRNNQEKSRNSEKKLWKTTNEIEDGRTNKLIQ